MYHSKYADSKQDKTAHYWVGRPYDADHAPWASVDSMVEAGELSGLPCMADFQPNGPQRTYQDLLLKHLRPGDIHTHVYAQQFPILDDQGRVNEWLETFFGEGVSSFHVDTWRDAMVAIQEGMADFAVLPIENSTAGIVSEVYDLLVEFDNYIVGEQIIRIENALMGLKGAELADIRTVYSHPQALMQSSRFLAEHRDWQIISIRNTAVAAKKVVDEQDKTQAAIAGKHAAKYYGLHILKDSLNDDKSNSTRFIVVTNQKIYRKEAKKVSVCFELPHESGSLFNILSHFIYNNLNMTKIESRPLEGRNWEYRFFVDFEGNLSGSSVKNALRGIAEEAINMRILGNY